ncbi:MAG: nucleoside phosphorylase [Proteobacteria bacterium]|nr:nucleoside phosphorylase [Pseudomonadota bacterium]MCP4919000.1 nucleoside phosphorylase [Pseudomonadota bacterium]
MTPRASEVVAHAGRVYHLGLAPGELAERIVLVGDPARALRVAARFETLEHEVREREFVTLTGTWRGHRLSVIGTGIGTDNVEIALVEAHVVHAMDLETGAALPDPPRLTFLRVGTSGGAREDVAPGTLAIAAYGLGLDSTGLFYEGPPADQTVTELEEQAAATLRAGESTSSRFRGAVHPYAARADEGLVTALAQAATEAGLSHEVGVTCALPGFYAPSGRYMAGLRATLPDIKERLGTVEAGGVRLLNFEMESSLLFHVAGQLGHRAGTICPILSTPGSHGTLIDGKAAVEPVIDLALEVLAGLD